MELKFISDHSFSKKKSVQNAQQVHGSMKKNNKEEEKISHNLITNTAQILRKNSCLNLGNDEASIWRKTNKIDECIHSRNDLFIK